MGQIHFPKKKGRQPQTSRHWRLLLSYSDLSLIITTDFEVLSAYLVSKMWSVSSYIRHFFSEQIWLFPYTIFLWFWKPGSDETKEVFGTGLWFCRLFYKYPVIPNLRLSQEKNRGDWNEANCFIVWKFASEAAQEVVKCKSCALKFPRVFTELHLWLCSTTKISCECANRPYENVLSPSICHFLTGLIGKHL